MVTDGSCGGSSTVLPSGFRLSGSAVAKESHKQPIYCVDWSSDVFSQPADMQQQIDNLAGADASSSGSGSESSSEEHVDDSSSTIGSDGSPFRMLATCGGNHVTVYETAYGTGLNMRQAYRDSDDDEIFYVCAFGGRGLGTQAGYAPVGTLQEDGKGGSTIVLNSDSPGTDNAGDDEEEPSEKRRKLLQTLTDLAQYDGPQLLAVAGKRGIVKVIDTVRRSLILTLSGHGDEIYDMKYSPVDEWLLLTASKDESLRLWNVKTATCIAIFAGHEGHRDAVLSCAWHPLGARFATGGMDNSVKVYSLESSEIKNAIEESSLVEPQKKKNLALSEPPVGSSPATGYARKAFKTLYEQMPIFSTSKMHLDYCDCVCFVGDLILSKSINDVIVLWKPILTDEDAENKTRSTYNGNSNEVEDEKIPVPRIKNEVQLLREFILNKCDIWFIRFQTDHECRMLAVGNNIGEIKVWDLDSSNPSKKHFAKVDHQHCASAVRMVSFSPDGRSLVAVSDDSTVWKWDGNH